MENGLELCVVPAFAVLQARREALDACGDDVQALGIWMNACWRGRFTGTARGRSPAARL